MRWYVIQTSGWGDFGFKVVEAETVEQVVKQVCQEIADEHADDESFALDTLFDQFDIQGDYYAQREVSDDACYLTIIMPAPTDIWTVGKEY